MRMLSVATAILCRAIYDQRYRVGLMELCFSYAFFVSAMHV